MRMHETIVHPCYARFMNDLARHDTEMLARIDRALDLTGAREGIAAVSRVDLGDLLKLPV